MPNRTHVRRLVPISLLVLALAGGCSAKASIGGASLDEAEVEEKVAVQLAESVGQPKPAVDCPGELEGKVGATITCTLVAQGETQKYPVTVTVTEVNDDVATFNAQVGAEPLP